VRSSRVFGENVNLVHKNECSVSDPPNLLSVFPFPGRMTKFRFQQGWRADEINNAVVVLI
jgi:hypothetical protein